MTVSAKSQDIESVLCTTIYDFTLNVHSMFRYRGNLVKFVGSRKAVKSFRCIMETLSSFKKTFRVSVLTLTACSHCSSDFLFPIPIFFQILWLL